MLIRQKVKEFFMQLLGLNPQASKEQEVAEPEPEPGLTLAEKIEVLHQNEVMSAFLRMLAELVLDIDVGILGEADIGNSYKIKWIYMQSGYALMYADEVLLQRIIALAGHRKEVHERFQFNPEIIFVVKTDDLARLKEAWVTLKTFQTQKEAEKFVEEEERRRLEAEYKEEVEKQIEQLGIDAIVQSERCKSG